LRVHDAAKRGPIGPPRIGRRAQSVEMAFGILLILVAILEIAVIVRVVQRAPAS
jgi:hypothetical protein